MPKCLAVSDGVIKFVIKFYSIVYSCSFFCLAVPGEGFVADNTIWLPTILSMNYFDFPRNQASLDNCIYLQDWQEC